VANYRCVTKGHLNRCERHDCYFRPGWKCVQCAKQWQRKERGEGHIGDRPAKEKKGIGKRGKVSSDSEVDQRKEGKGEQGSEVDQKKRQMKKRNGENHDNEVEQRKGVDKKVPGKRNRKKKRKGGK
jgi:hypothetical protein